MKAICGILAAGLVGAGAWAQEANIVEGESAGVPAKVEKSTNAPVEQAQQSAAIDEKSMIGKTVIDEKGREIGRVKELVTDQENGELGYVVLAVKDDEELKLPVPARALKPAADGQKLMLNVSESVLTALEVYRDEELPEADAFSVEGETAVGGAAGTEKGTAASAEKKNEKESTASEPETKQQE